MSSFISREDAIAELEKVDVRVAGLRVGKCILTEFTNQCRATFVEAVANLPAAEDVEQVRHGAWIFVGKDTNGNRIIKCSHCGTERKNQAKSAYCRDCGARMDLVEECVSCGAEEHT